MPISPAPNRPAVPTDTVEDRLAALIGTLVITDKYIPFQFTTQDVIKMLTWVGTGEEDEFDDDYDSLGLELFIGKDGGSDA